ncbi:ATP-dependent Clp protease ATP-binding subunit, partial [Patescibacteria group bacterium]|nr:ATP-dependent Clp protease ATP-binding subunit [Patescibacteria group bacterium]
NIILYINNIENLTGITAGKEQSLDLSEILSNALERKNLICLATATNENYIKYLENKPLGNVLAKVVINEPEINQAIQIIESKIGFLEAQYNIYFSYDSIAKVVDLTDKYVHDKYLPAKAIDILKSIAVKIVKLKGANSLITGNDVAKVISEITGIPVAKITESESQALLNLEEKIHERMIDQVEAVNVVSASLRRARVELRETKRPIASFLFLGPTGVGKTELAKAVAEIYFSNEDYMIRVDMSEYQHSASIEKMIGSHDGTLGYLTEAVRKSPFSLVLLDEFEKAHPDILNLFLQVMDDGRLTDGQGKTIDFTNSIIIATSNVGAVFIQDQLTISANIEEIKQKLINEYLNKVLRPELINRFDNIVVFKPLNINDIEQITKLMLTKVGKMLEVKGIGFKITEKGIKKIAQEGFDPKFGARPLRRLIQEKIENKIADIVLTNKIKRRDIISIDDNALIQIEKGARLK